MGGEILFDLVLPVLPFQIRFEGFAFPFECVFAGFEFPFEFVLLDGIHHSIAGFEFPFD